MANKSSNRNHVRFEYEGVARFRVVDRSRAWRALLEEDAKLREGKVLNLCEEGMSLHTRQPLQEGETLKMRYPSNHKKKDTVALAQVRWISPHLSGIGFVSGLKILTVLDERRIPALARFCQETYY